jgi:hypothetical protein
MRIFLSEYLTCGAFTDAGNGRSSLAVEGAAMIRTLAADAAAVPGWHVTVTWDATLDPFGVPGVEVLPVRTPSEEQDLFGRLAAEADVTFVIAPEFDGLLEARSRMISEVGGRSVGSTSDAIALCGDKLALAEQLARCNIPTIGTRHCDFTELAELVENSPQDGFIVKPRFGAGAVGLFRIRNRSELAEARQACATDQPFGEPLVQPFMRGLSLSAAGIVSPIGVELFPVARQQVVGEHRLEYAGGSLPAATGHDEAVADVARLALAAVPGLRGYVGVDLLLPAVDNGFGLPIVIEINPRLTTSYLGYRLLAAENLAERLLTPDIPRPAIRWRTGRVEFKCNGTVAFTHEDGTP